MVPDPAHLTRRYIAALAIVAALSIAGQALIQRALTRHADDSQVINIAGRQRMLSQRLSKTALALNAIRDGDDRSDYFIEFVAVLNEWEATHRALARGDDVRALRPENGQRVRAMYEQIEPSFEAMVAAGREIAMTSGGSGSFLDDAVRRLLGAEPVFLAGMNAIVFQYQRDAEARVSEVRRIEFALLCLILLTLLLEGLFVFRPAVSRIRRTLGDLGDALTQLRVTEAEKSAMLQAIPDVIFRLNRAGAARPAQTPGEDVTEATPGFGSTLAEAMPGVTRGVIEEYLSHTARAIADRAVTSFEHPIASIDGHRHMEARFVACGPNEVLVLVRDLSERRRLEREILEISEREQERIGQDIHDDLCQQLAGIRFMAESVAVCAARGAQVAAGELQSLAELSQRALSVASGVARGLYPTSLAAYGLSAALGELVSATNARHTVTCTHDIQLDDLVLPREVALQMYRIAQQALSNAVKHADAKTIHVSARILSRDLVVLVVDDGIGIPPPAERGDGMGLRIMKNRARMIGAFLAIERVMDDDAHSRGGALDNDAPSRDAETDEREGGESARDDASADEDPAAGQRPRRARGTRVICRLPDVEATRTQSEP